MLNSSAPVGGTVSVVNGLRHVSFAPSDFATKTQYISEQYDNLPSSATSLGAISFDKVIDPLGHVTTTYKNIRGQAFMTMFDNGSYTLSYVGIGTNPVVGHEPATHGMTGQTITGHQETKIDQMGRATDSFYDASGRLTDMWLPAVDDATTTSPELVRPHWHYTYDSQGNELRQYDPTQDNSAANTSDFTSFTYDALGRRLTRTLPGLVFPESWQYDEFGRVLTHMDFDQNVHGASSGYYQVTYYEYNSLGRLIAEYRGVPELSSDTQHHGYGVALASEKTVYGYDTFGRQNQVDEYVRRPDGTMPATPDRTTLTTFDPITGQVSSVESPEGVIHYEYDPHTGRKMAMWVGSTRSGASNETDYGYDSLGRLEHVYAVVLNGSRYATFGSWDAASQEPVLTGGTALVTAYSYYDDGSLHTLTEPNGVVTSYEYDSLNRLEHLTSFKDMNLNGSLDAGEFKLFTQDYTLLNDGQRDYVIEKKYDGASTTPFNTTRIDWEYDGLT